MILSRRRGFGCDGLGAQKRITISIVRPCKLQRRISSMSDASGKVHATRLHRQ